MRTLLALCLGCCLFAIAGCGSESESDPGAALGEACTDGNECKSDLFCLIEVDGEDGKCTEIPAACAEVAKCSSECFDDVKASCAGGSSCTSIAGNVTLTCAGP